MDTTETIECAVCHGPAVVKLFLDERPEDTLPRWTAVNVYCAVHGERHLATQRRLDAIARMPMGRWTLAAVLS